MTPPIDPGSLPDWIEASTGIAALAVTTRNRIKQRGSDFGNAVKDGTGLSGAAIAEALEEDDLLCELVERGLRSAVASSSESKRRLLAKVVSSAISGDGLATPDEYRILMGTVEELEPPHVQLLVLLSTPPTEHTSFDGTRLEGAYTELEIAQRQPEASVVLVRPLLAALVREGLIQDVGPGTYDGGTIPAFTPTAYGRKFLDFLSEVDLNGLRPDGAALAARYEESPHYAEGVPHIIIKNLGPGSIRLVNVTAKPSGNGQNPLIDVEMRPEELRPWDEYSLEAHQSTLTFGPPFELEVTSNGPDGLRIESLIVGGN